MIGNNDLYDISAVFTIIRAEVRYEKNISILHRIIKVLLIKDFYEYNQIRNAIAEIPDLDRGKWCFVYHQNLYVYNVILKNQKLINILIKICEELISALQSQNYDLAGDLADAIHCLPNIIAENKYTIPKNYWKSHVQFYRNKWDKDFFDK